MKVDGKFYEIADAPALDKKFKHDIDVVVDRIVVRGDIATRLADSFETALELADGIAIVEFADAPSVSLPGLTRQSSEGNVAPLDLDGRVKPGHDNEKTPGQDKKRKAPTKAPEPERITFSQRFACPVSGFTIDEIEPRLFSFNNPFGACPKCDGLGTELKFEPALVVPDQSLSLRKGAVVPWARTGNTSPYYTQTLEALANHYNVTMETPWSKLPKKVQDAILFGTGGEVIAFTYDDGMRTYTTRKAFEGVVTNIERRWKETDSQWVREELSRYQSDAPCQECGGMRLKPQALAVKVGRQAYRRGVAAFHPRCERLVRGASRQAHREAERDRHAHPEGNPRTAALPQRCRPRLSRAVAQFRHAVGRRKPAHPAGLADRLGADGRALRAGRAVHRPASARQRPLARHAEAPARSRQFRSRRGA